MTGAAATVSDKQREAERRLQAIPAAINADQEHARRARLLDADVLIGVGGTSFIMTVRSGRLGELEPATRLLRPWTFAIRAEAATWLMHWQNPPKAGWHDIFALSKRGLLTMEGNLVPLMQHLQFVKDVLAAPRNIR